MYWLSVNYNKCITSRQDVNNRGNYRGRGESVMGLSGLSAQFFCKPEPSQLNKVYHFFNSHQKSLKIWITVVSTASHRTGVSWWRWWFAVNIQFVKNNINGKQTRGKVMRVNFPVFCWSDLLQQETYTLGCFEQWVRAITLRINNPPQLSLPSELLKLWDGTQ